MIKFIICTLSTVAAVLAIQLGIDWVEIGYGLHPAIAVVLALALVFGNYMLFINLPEITFQDHHQEIKQ
jgi:hypothetical protein